MSLNQLVDSRDVWFTLFEMLEMGKLNRYDHFKDYDRSVYEDTLDLSEKIALEQFYPSNSFRKANSWPWSRTPPRSSRRCSR